MKYLLYTLEDIKEKEKIPKNCVLILENHFFTTMLLTIVPSVDEDDRKEMIYEKLSQEYFLDVNELQYVYYDIRFCPVRNNFLLLFQLYFLFCLGIISKNSICNSGMLIRELCF